MGWSLRRSRGLGAPIPITLRIDNPIQQVGGKATFLIIGAPPGAPVYWSSYRNGVATGELNADYGHRVEANGTAKIEMSSPWTAEQAGDWIKEILIQDSTGNNYTAMAVFRVVPAPVAAPAPAPATSGGGLLSGSFRVAGVDVPNWLPLVAVGAVVLARK
jgi:hypothetical protein